MKPAVTEVDVLNAIRQIKTEGVPLDRKSTKYHMIHGGVYLPPKYVWARAVELAAGKPLKPSEHNGGAETHRRLARLGFVITQWTPARIVDGPAWLLRPPHLLSSKELDDVDDVPGVYGWYFDALPEVMTIGGHRHPKFENWMLGYVGVAPARKESSGTLKKRIASHFGGNSTLGDSIGSLETILRARPNGLRESVRSWMTKHARVTYAACDQPWKVEERLLASALTLPLNIRDNESHPFALVLRYLRRVARQ